MSLPSKLKSLNTILSITTVLPSIILGIVLFKNPNYLQTIIGILVALWVIVESLIDLTREYGDKFAMVILKKALSPHIKSHIKSHR